VLLSCAKQGLPPGGPEDQRGPIILSTVPTADSIGIPCDIQPVFQFDEYVDRALVEAATFISPFPEGTVRFKWKGKRVRLVFPQPLRENMTYVITMGTGIKDLRGNPLPTAFTLAFSTGDHLDRAAISGRIYDNSDLTGTQVWAYDLSSNPDPDPQATGPDYVTQADEAGIFELTHLREASYRIFGINDRRRNRKWDPNEDRIGIAFLDVTAIQDNIAYGVNMMMSLLDTTGARLVSVRAMDQHHLTIRFSKPVTVDSALGQVSIRDSSDVTLAVQAVFPDPSDSLSWSVVTEPQTDGHRYFLWGKGFLDNNKNPNLPDSVVFEGSSVPDTLGPRLLQIVPADRSRDVPDKPNIRLIFNEEIIADSSALSFTGAIGEPLTFDWHIDGLLLIAALRDSMPGINVTAYLRLPMIQDWFGNAGADSTVYFGFFIVSRDTLGEIHGTVEDSVASALGRIFIEADRLDMVNSQWHEQWQIIGPGDFRLRWLLPGKYRIQAFRDEDWSGAYSYGSPYPFVLSERFAVYPDTVTVRSRWETAGVTIALPARQAVLFHSETSDSLKGKQ